MKVIIISPSGRTGSFLIHSLLDSHPEIICFPGAIKYYLLPEKITNPYNEVVEFISNNHGLFDYKNRSAASNSLLGKNRDEHILIDKLLFKKIILKELKGSIDKSQVMSRREFVISLHIALAKITNVNIKKIKHMLVHLHNYDGSHFLAKLDFPDLYFLACLRDPRENCYSFLKFFEKIDGKNNLLMRTYRRDNIIIDNEIAYKSLLQFYASLNKDQTLFIDLNQLHSFGTKGMKKLADKLQIKFYNSMVKTTFLGKVWWGNAASGKLADGLNIKKADFNWPKKLPKEDEVVVSTILKKYIAIFGYQTGTIDNKIKFSDPRTSFINLKIILRSIIVDSNYSTSKKILRFPLPCLAWFIKNCAYKFLLIKMFFRKPSQFVDEIDCIDTKQFLN